MTKVKSTEEKIKTNFYQGNIFLLHGNKTLIHISPSADHPIPCFPGHLQENLLTRLKMDLSECQSSRVRFAMSVSTRNKKLSRASPRVCFGIVDIECHLKLTTCFPSFCCQKTLMPFFLNPSASVSSSSADDLRPCGHTIEQIKKKEKVKTQQTRSECCGS